MTASKPVVNANEGAIADLHCVIQASPAARIHWTRNGKVLGSSDKYKVHIHPHEKHHHNMTTLHIRDVTLEDLGDYKCHSENNYGKNEGTVMLAYEPELALYHGCKLTDDLHTVQCNWTVRSMQPVSEGLLFYKQSGERKWKQVEAPSTIEKLEEDNKWE